MAYKFSHGVLWYGTAFLLLLLYSYGLQAQKTSHNMLSGEYYLQGIMEVGSGLRFNPDSTFDFFFSYGAVDRASRGTWLLQGDTVFLDTAPKPEQDFILQESRTAAGSPFLVKISHPNSMLLPFVYVWVKTPEGVLEGKCNNDGMAFFDRVTKVESITLVHELWADRLSVFAIPAGPENYFEFNIAPWITEVAFHHLPLILVDEKTLKGGHPLLEGSAFMYKM
jgi:hypothetical protein